MKLIYLSGLNGLRAIAALAVLFSHITGELTSFGLNSFVFGKHPDGTPKATLLAGFGVTIFFALSGFLITYLLLQEYKATNSINIRNFYIRRVLRIWPLYYLYLGLSLVTLILFNIDFEGSFILYYVFLASNVPFILAQSTPFLGHYWSLGVEEQFYSFWPWIVKKSKSIVRTTVIICISLIFLKCVLRYMDIVLHHGDITLPYTFIHVTRFHCMLIGALGAIFYSGRNQFFLRMTNNYLMQALSWLVIFLALINKFHIASFLDNEMIAVISVVLIIGQVEKDHRIINLENSALNFIGKISYGIYVIHPLVIFYLSRIIRFSSEAFTLDYVLVYFSVFSITILLAFLSFEFFEKKFLLLKVKYDSRTQGV
jgi:peptidoglycan/LPS O-acetylase OafA/YrhL